MTYVVEVMERDLPFYVGGQYGRPVNGGFAWLLPGQRRPNTALFEDWPVAIPGPEWIKAIKHTTGVLTGIRFLITGDLIETTVAGAGAYGVLGSVELVDNGRARGMVALVLKESAERNDRDLLRRAAEFDRILRGES